MNPPSVFCEKVAQVYVKEGCLPSKKAGPIGKFELSQLINCDSWMVSFMEEFGCSELLAKDAKSAKKYFASL